MYIYFDCTSMLRKKLINKHQIWKKQQRVMIMSLVGVLFSYTAVVVPPVSVRGCCRRTLVSRSRCTETFWWWLARSAPARVFPSRLGCEPLWMWECGYQRLLWALPDTRRRCAHGRGSPQRLAVVQVSGAVLWGMCGGGRASETSKVSAVQRPTTTPPPFICLFLLGIFLPSWGGGHGMRAKPRRRRIPRQHHGATHCRQREYQQTPRGASGDWASLSWKHSTFPLPF